MSFRISHLRNDHLTGCTEHLQAQSSANRGRLETPLTAWYVLPAHQGPVLQNVLTSPEECFREQDHQVNQVYFSKALIMEI